MATKFESDFNDKVIKRIRKAIAKSGRDLPKEIGNEAVAIIKKRTRQGKGVGVKGGAEGKFIELSPVTHAKRLKARKGKAKPPLAGADKTQPKKSNLTWTGQLLDSLYVKSASMKKVVIGFRVRRRGEGTKLSNLTNPKLAKIHDRLGTRIGKVKRPFFRLSRRDQSKILRYVRRRVREILGNTR